MNHSRKICSRVVLFGGRLPVQLLDQRRDLLLVGEHLLEHASRRPEVARRLGQRLEDNPSIAVLDEVEELHRVLPLFVGLEPHPVGEARQVLIVAVRRHRRYRYDEYSSCLSWSLSASTSAY